MLSPKMNARKKRGKTDAMLVLSTIDDPLAARRIAGALVEEHLAACVNVSAPIESTYRWRGALTTQTEHLMIIKTRAPLYEALERRLKALHPYEEPEIIGIELKAGARGYLEWLKESTGGPALKARAGLSRKPAT
jgi:periplasmic divalent cation tolerance protein